MSDSLFLDPFAVPSRDPRADDASAGPQGMRPGAQGAEQGAAEPVVAGTVVDSSPASENAKEAVTALVPLDLEQTVGAVLDDTHLWWPRDLRATGADGHVFFEDGKLLEEGGEGEAHLWADIRGTAAAELDLEWFGRGAGGGTTREDVTAQDAGSSSASSSTGGSTRADAPPQRGSGTRLFLGFEQTGQGTNVTVKGNRPASWAEEWTRVLGALAKFTGGSLKG
jgi:hypothetical protein